MITVLYLNNVFLYARMVNTLLAVPFAVAERCALEVIGLADAFFRALR